MGYLLGEIAQYYRISRESLLPGAITYPQASINGGLDSRCGLCIVKLRDCTWRPYMLGRRFIAGRKRAWIGTDAKKPNRVYELKEPYTGM